MESWHRCSGTPAQGPFCSQSQESQHTAHPLVGSVYHLAAHSCLLYFSLLRLEPHSSIHLWEELSYHD